MGAKYNFKFWRIWIRYTPGFSFEVMTKHRYRNGDIYWRFRFGKYPRPTTGDDKDE